MKTSPFPLTLLSPSSVPFPTYKGMTALSHLLSESQTILKLEEMLAIQSIASIYRLGCSETGPNPAPRYGEARKRARTFSSSTKHSPFFWALLTLSSGTGNGAPLIQKLGMGSSPSQDSQKKRILTANVSNMVFYSYLSTSAGSLKMEEEE